jgi:hypothetical protein
MNLVVQIFGPQSIDRNDTIVYWATAEAAILVYAKIRACLCMIDMCVLGARVEYSSLQLGDMNCLVRSIWQPLIQ